MSVHRVWGTCSHTRSRSRGGQSTSNHDSFLKSPKPSCDLRILGVFIKCIASVTPSTLRLASQLLWSISMFSPRTHGPAFPFRQPPPSSTATKNTISPLALLTQPFWPATKNFLAFVPTVDPHARRQTPPFSKSSPDFRFHTTPSIFSASIICPPPPRSSP